MALTLHKLSEAQLLAGCQKNDRTAQQQLYASYSGKMYALCCRYVKSKMEAEDVLVTAFTKVFDKIDQFKNEGSFEGWIRRIVVNEALTWIRKNRSLYLETDLEKADYEPDYDHLSDHLETEDLLRMIQALPTGYQLVFNLYAIDGYSHKEIAEQLNISENTSKSQLSRARVYLQKLLAQQDWHLQQNFKSDEGTNR
ncbi:MAG: sigma-70 family RNA polymerase sigma factor [Cyclobacteriaceae bacterium]|jgi:RNA polymerase sigma-70 factor (ECF subfamily)|nr:sigma-70 family RNA polymerase sigma factor [Cyclobacteriaceae bacterium]